MNRFLPFSLLFVLAGCGDAPMSPEPVEPSFDVVPVVCGTTYLNSQAAVDAFNCTSVVGTLTISGSEITNLDGLSELTDVSVDLRIDNTGVVSFAPLSGLGSVGGTLFLVSNPALTGLSGLSELTSLGGRLIALSNASLASLEGLSGLTTVGGHLTIRDNAALTSIGAFPGLQSIPGSLYIQGNASLTDLSGLSALTSVAATVRVFGNQALAGLDGLGGLTSIGEDLVIFGNGALPSLDGLGGLTSIGRQLVIGDNAALSSLDGLSGLTSLPSSVARLMLIDNPVLTNVDGLSGLTGSVRELIISGNASLTDVDGLLGLTSVRRYLSVRDNAALSNLDGLSGLNGTLGLPGRPSEGIEIVGNGALTDVDGLSGITMVYAPLTITDNPSLTGCGISSLLGEGAVTGTLTIRNNGVLFCSSVDQLPPLLDADGDAVLNGDDEFPFSTVGGTVVIEGCSTSVENQGLTGGATFMDRIGKAKVDAKNRGQFVSAVSHLANEWKKAGLISGNDKGAITSCTGG